MAITRRVGGTRGRNERHQLDNRARYTEEHEGIALCRLFPEASNKELGSRRGERETPAERSGAEQRERGVAHPYGWRAKGEGKERIGLENMYVACLVLPFFHSFIPLSLSLSLFLFIFSILFFSSIRVFLHFFLRLSCHLFFFLSFGNLSRNGHLSFSDLINILSDLKKRVDCLGNLDQV